MRAHGGDLDRAIDLYGGVREDWIDLSTGINRLPYPVPRLEAWQWTNLPTSKSMEALKSAARTAYATDAPIVAVAGAQAAIQMIPHLAPPGDARVLSPTYNEHAACLRVAGWNVREVSDAAELEGAGIAVVVNPNNPDGRCYQPDELLQLRDRVGRLVVDESFADPMPEISLAGAASRPGLIVLRSFGKFYGLAGLRLGFALGPAEDTAALEALAGPWPVSGMALEVGSIALSDRAWATDTARRLKRDARRLDDLVRSCGWRLAGGTQLFRCYDTDAAYEAQARLARSFIWSRVFPWSANLLRLGLPGDEREWTRLAAALE